MGSCALVALVVGKKVFIANCGDSKAVLLSESSDSEFVTKNLSKTFSANKASEQQRLKKQFSREHDVVKCRTPDACFVKGEVSCTKAIGDMRLKKKEFNFHDFGPEYGYRKPLTSFTGPYISAEPDIQVHTLKPSDRYLVLGTGGLWHEIKRKDTGKIASQVLKEPPQYKRMEDKPFTFQLSYVLC